MSQHNDEASAGGKLGNSAIGSAMRKDTDQNDTKKQGVQDLHSDTDGSFDDHSQPEEQQGQEGPAGGLFTWKNMKAAWPNILVPTLYGYSTGVVSVYSTMYKYATDCQLFKSEKSCVTLYPAKCAWENIAGNESLGVPAGYQCVFADRMTCSHNYKTEEPCVNNDVCKWDYAAKTCGNAVGYPTIINGLFAGSMIIGAFIGSLIGGTLTKWLNFPLTFLVIGIMAIIASILAHISTGLFVFWLIFAARIFLGLAMGWQAVAAPAYSSMFGDKRYQSVFGSLFQVFNCFGSFVAAIIGISLGMSIDYSADRNAYVMGRLQGFMSFPTLLSILTIFLFFMVKKAIKKPEYEEDDEDDGEDNAKYPLRMMIRPLLVGFVMSCTMQLTGINAMMNFSPTIMGNLGLPPLVGNLVVMAWNSITAFTVIPLAKWFSMRALFLNLSIAGSLACLFLCGIPLYPGVTSSEQARNGLSIAGIFIFILTYEAGTGPTFFVLARDVFPESFRHIGTSVTTMWQFIFTLIINICYPIATEGMSGGPAGNQNKGQSIAFLFFGCIGLVTSIIEYFCLQPWSEVVKSSKAEQKAEAEAAANNSQNGDEENSGEQDDTSGNRENGNAGAENQGSQSAGKGGASSPGSPPGSPVFSPAEKKPPTALSETK